MPRKHMLVSDVEMPARPGEEMWRQKKQCVFKRAMIIFYDQFLLLGESVYAMKCTRPHGVHRPFITICFVHRGLALHDHARIFKHTFVHLVAFKCHEGTAHLFERLPQAFVLLPQEMQRFPLEIKLRVRILLHPG